MRANHRCPVTASVDAGIEHLLRWHRDEKIPASLRVPCSPESQATRRSGCRRRSWRHRCAPVRIISTHRPRPVQDQHRGGRPESAVVQLVSTRSGLTKTLCPVPSLVKVMPAGLASMVHPTALYLALSITVHVTKPKSPLTHSDVPSARKRKPLARWP